MWVLHWHGEKTEAYNCPAEDRRDSCEGVESGETSKNDYRPAVISLFVNIYRLFVANFTRLAKTLYRLLKGKEKIWVLPELTDEQMSSFRALIDTAVSPTVLLVYRGGMRYSLDTDAWNYQIGPALFRIRADSERQSIGFELRKLNSQELNYSVSEKEFQAVLFSITNCRPYLVQDDFDLDTDYQCLRWLMETSEPIVRLMRWRLRLAEYVISIYHKKG